MLYKLYQPFRLIFESDFTLWKARWQNFLLFFLVHLLVWPYQIQLSLSMRNTTRTIDSRVHIQNQFRTQRKTHNKYTKLDAPLKILDRDKKKQNRYEERRQNGHDSHEERNML
jgi:hypothetical protein